MKYPYITLHLFHGSGGLLEHGATTSMLRSLLGNVEWRELHARSKT
jgi:hypothetical protein